MAGGRTVGRVNIKVWPKTKGFATDLKSFLERVERAAKVEVEVEADTSGLKPEVDRETERISRTSEIEVKVKADRNSLKALKKALSGLGTVSKVVAISAAVLTLVAALSSLAGPIVGAAAALWPIIQGLGVALPAALVAAAVGFGALKIGMSGFGTALSSLGDTEAFNEALKKLTPNAQALAKALKALQPQFAALKKSVQEKLFEGLAKPIGNLVKLSLPALQEGFGIAATGISTALARMATSFSTAKSQLKIKELFEGSGLAVANLSKALEPLAIAFLHVASAAAPMVAAVAGDAAGALARFSGRVQNFVAGGGVARIFSGMGEAVAGFKELGSDIAGIFRSIGKAAGEAGTSVVAGFGSSLQTLNSALASVKGQAFLVELFTQLRDVMVALNPVLGALGGALTPVLAILGKLAVAIGPGLVAILEGLQGGFEALVPSAKPLGDMLTSFARAVSPLLPVLGELINGALLPLIGLLDKFYTAMQPVSEQFAGALSSEVAGLSSAFKGFVEALEPAIGPLVLLAKAALPLLLNAVKTLATALEIVTPLMKIFAVGMLLGLAPLILLALAVKLLTDGIRLLPAAFKAAASGIGNFFSTVGGFLADMGSTILDFFKALPGQVFNVLKQIPGLVVDIFTAIPGLIIFALTELPGMIISFFGMVIAGAITAISVGLAAILGFWFALPGRIIAAVSALLSLAKNFFTTVVTAAKALIVNGFNAVVNFFVMLPSRIMSGINSLRTSIASLFSAAVSRAKSSIVEGFGAVVSFVRTIPGKIKSALGNTSRMLYDAGKAIMNGLRDGIIDAAKNVAKAARDAVSRIKDVLPGSPVKEGPLKVLNKGYAGGQIAQMIADGIRSNTGAVVNASTNLAAKIAGQLPTPENADAGGQFSGNLVLDSGEFLGRVRGEIGRSQRSLARDLAIGRT